MQFAIARPVAGRTGCRKRDGQDANALMLRLAGNPMRIAATSAKPCAWMNALTKCVVPIITASIAEG